VWVLVSDFHSLLDEGLRLIAELCHHSAIGDGQIDQERKLLPEHLDRRMQLATTQGLAPRVWAHPPSGGCLNKEMQSFKPGSLSKALRAGQTPGISSVEGFSPLRRLFQRCRVNACINESCVDAAART